MNKRNSLTVIKVIAGICFVVGLSFFIGCKSSSREKRITVDSGHRLIMGTFARIVAVADDEETADKCIKAGFEQLEFVNNLMSVYSIDSELSKVNRRAYKDAVKVSEPLFEVLQRSLVFSRKTGGAFDITVGLMVDLFRSAEKKGAAPSKEQIAQAKLKVGFEKLKLDEQNQTVRFAVEGMRLDLGGIAKGYAIDKAVGAMQGSGALGGMVDVGGDIRCFGLPSKGKSKWRIGLQDPNTTKEYVSPDEPLLILELTDKAVATSGDYRQFVLIEGKKYSHIIDSKIGHSGGELSSVTIISGSATDADALATAVSVMGTEKGLALIETEPGTEAILIPSDTRDKFIKTSGAEKFIK